MNERSIKKAFLKFVDGDPNSLLYIYSNPEIDKINISLLPEKVDIKIIQQLWYNSYAHILYNWDIIKINFETTSFVKVIGNEIKYKIIRPSIKPLTLQEIKDNNFEP